MARWIGLSQAARYHAATTPDFLPAEFASQVLLVGSPANYATSLGYNILSPLGEEKVDFYAALYSFCLEQYALGLGWQPYQPAFVLEGIPQPQGPELEPAGDPGADPQLEGDADEPMEDDAEGEQELLPPNIAPPPGDPVQIPAPTPQHEDQHPNPAMANPVPNVPPHLLGPNIGVVLPIMGPNPNAVAAVEEDPNVIELD
jgi:hypothetical protein